MLYLLLLFLHVSSLNTQSTEHGEANGASLNCILPPYPKNGHYVLLEPEIPASPGDRLNNFTLEVTCDPGYHNTATIIHLCLDGDIFEPITECLPYCTEVTPDVMSCGLGTTGQESRCLVSPQLFSNSLRGAVIEDTLGECGQEEPQSATVIAGGRIALKKELPWHAGIYTKTKRPYMQICGGSLVSETVVISAAHCFWSDIDKQRPATDYAAAVGKLYRPWNDDHDNYAQKSDVVEIKIPPRFQGSETNLQDDIALVIVSDPFTYTSAVKPVCVDFDVALDEKQLAPGMYGRVGGWGLTSENGRESPVLKVVEMPIVAINECIDKSDPSFRVHITSDKICAGYQNGTAVCKGDSGGGLSFPDIVLGVRRHFLRGVVSAAPRNQNLCNTVSWATFTHVLKHEHFIRETVPAKSSSMVIPEIEIPPPSFFQQTEFYPVLDLS